MEELYKRKSFKFSSEAMGRYSRHAETLRARESSRFKRISMIRSMTIESENSLVETELEKKDDSSGTSVTAAHAVNGNCSEKEMLKPTENIIQKDVKVPSRLECLKKWKQEKIRKQELEKEKLKPAFYAGAKAIAPISKGSSLIKTNLKTSFLGQKNVNMNTSKLPDRSIALSNLQSARIPYNFKAAANSYSNKIKEANNMSRKPVSALPALKAPVSKSASLKKEAPVSTKKVFAQSSLPVSKNGSASKTASSTNKVNSTLKSFTSSAFNRSNSASKLLSQNGNASKTTSSANKAIPISKSATPNTFTRSNSANKVSSQSGAVSQATSCVNKSKSIIKTNLASASTKIARENSSASKLSNQNGAIPNTTSSMNRSNSTNRTNHTSAANTVRENSSASKLTAKGSFVNRPGISRLPNKQIQKVPSAISSKPVGLKAPSRPVPKPQGVKPVSTSNFQKNTPKSFSSSLPKPTGNKVLDKNEIKKTEENPTKSAEELNVKQTVELEVTDKTIIPEVTFNCDLSLINGFNSFAPKDFQFKPPTTLSSFFDDDPIEAFEQAGKFMTRTSTPSKPVSRNSVVKPAPEIVNESISTISEKSDENQMCSKSSSLEVPAAKDPRISDYYPLQKYFDDDPYEAFAIANKKYLPRVSTPGRDISKKISLPASQRTSPTEDTKEQSVFESSGIKSFKHNIYDNPADTMLFNAVSLMSESPGVLLSDADMFNDDENINDVDLKLVKNSPTEECLSIENTEKEVITVEENLVFNFNQEEKCIENMNSSNKTADVNVEALQADSNVDKDPENVKDAKELLSIDNCEETLKSISLVTLETVKNDEAQSAKVDFVFSPEVETIADPGTSEIKTSDVLSADINNADSLVSQLPIILEEAAANQVYGSTDSGSLKEACINEFPEANGDLSSETFYSSTTEESLKVQVEKNVKMEDVTGSFEEKDSKVNDRKSTGAIPKRVSMLKKMSFLNSIAESPEAKDSNSASPQKLLIKSQVTFTPRRSPRLSKVMNRDDSKAKLGSQSGGGILSPLATPGGRRNSMKKTDAFVEDTKCVTPRRRSLRLINLNTPERDFGGSVLNTNLTADFEKLRITSENTDPSLVFDVENNFESVSRRVSLLYSPKRRQSCRKSIRGDLISFSPTDS